MKALRDAFGDEILQVGKENPNIYLIDCDVGKSCKTVPFKEALPEQYLNVGIAEQNAADVGAGLATYGKIPFVATYAAFGSMRMCEQIRQEICYPKLNVKIACSHGGFTPANDGASHQSIEDFGIMRTLPNMTVIVPCDYYSARRLIRAAAEHEGPAYLRFTRDAVPFIYDENDVNFEIGKSRVLREGKDACIIAAGAIMSMVMESCDILEAQGISVRLIDMHTIKPIDKEAVLNAINDIGKIVTVEDHNIINGLGCAVCEIVAEEGKGKVKRMGALDQFGESGPYYKLLAKNGVTAQNIANEVMKLVQE